MPLIRFIILSILMISIITSCGHSMKHPFHGRKFPTYCSDPEIEEQVNMRKNYYPVYIEYSAESLKNVEALFCTGLRPPNRVFRRDVNKESIEVAFFNSFERANTFREIIASRFSSAEVGNPITIQSAQDSQDIGLYQHIINRIASTFFPKIGEGDFKNLKKLIDRENSGIKNFQVALPTYIPDAFQRVDIEIHDKNRIKYHAEYTYDSRNSSQCFRVSGDDGRWGGDTRAFTSLNVSSSSLGNVRLDYVSFDRVGDVSQVFFRKRVPEIKEVVSNHYSMVSCKDGISLSEAIKIVESIRFLEP